MNAWLRGRATVALALTVAALAAAATLPHRRTHRPLLEGSASASLIDRGRYMAVAGDCEACHTSVPGEPFAGGVAIASPIGLIYSSNITPDAVTGIGSYSLDDFDRAVRHGIKADGTTLYPAMPYPSYARMTDDDLRALYAYFKLGVRAVPAPRAENRIRWPLSMRWPLALWRKLFSPDDPFDASRYADPAVARGAYLVQGPGHCGACHTPRGVFLEEQALDDSKDSYLAGVPVVDGWVAVSLRGDDADGLGAWSAEDIVRTLRSARNSAHAVIGGPMNDVVVHSTQYLTEEDLRAIAAYLKSLPEAARPPASFKADARTAAALAAGRESDRGAELYLDNCAACHRSNGEGAAGVLPAIAANSTVLAADPTSIIHLILRGSVLPATVSAPSRLGMPGFGWRLSDVEVAELATFIRASWGNHAPAVSASQVRNLREFLRGETLGTATANDPR